MNVTLRLILIGCLVLALGGCNTRTDKTDEGGVLLSVSDFDGLPIRVSINGAVAAGGLITIQSITIQSIVKDPTGSSSELMNVEMTAYEVTYTRGDTGTRVPPPLVRAIFGVTPAGGTQVYENLPFMSLDQLLVPPLSDLLVQNGQVDQETGQQAILLNVILQFFGETLSGKDVTTEPVAFSVEFVP